MRLVGIVSARIALGSLASQHAKHPNRNSTPERVVAFLRPRKRAINRRPLFYSFGNALACFCGIEITSSFLLLAGRFPIHPRNTTSTWTYTCDLKTQVTKKLNINDHMFHDIFCRHAPCALTVLISWYLR